MSTASLYEGFETLHLHPRLRWHCAPTRWAVDPRNRQLTLEPDGGTDFWRKTHYGFEADNGHFLFAEVAGDFVLTTHVRFSPVHQYDQAGLMIRHSPTCWLKTSVEYEPHGPSRLGAVVTNNAFSDWSTQAFPAERHEIWLRVHRTGGDYLMEASQHERDWQQIRLARLHDDPGGVPVAAGLYACSPKGAGYIARFSFLRLDVVAGS